MIICTGCGARNEDDSRYCEKCSKKLQSSHQSATQSEFTEWELPRFKHKGVAPDLKNDLKRMIEAWGYVTVLALVATGCFYYEIWWPLYPAIGILGLIVWLRRI